MNIQCPYCKKEIEKHSTQCEFCGHQIWEAYAINYFNQKRKEYDGHRGFLIVVMSFTVAGLYMIYYFIRKFAAIRHDDPSFCIPYIVGAGIITAIVCFILWQYYSFKMDQFKKERDSMLNDRIELCENCKRYKIKGEKCSCRDVRW